MATRFDVPALWFDGDIEGCELGLAGDLGLCVESVEAGGGGVEFELEGGAALGLFFGAFVGFGALGVDVEDGVAVFVEGYEVGEGTHDGLELGEGLAVEQSEEWEGDTYLEMNVNVQLKQETTTP